MGSEMCIRDRPAPPRCGQQTAYTCTDSDSQHTTHQSTPTTADSQRRTLASLKNPAAHAAAKLPNDRRRAALDTPPPKGSDSPPNGIENQP